MEKSQNSKTEKSTPSLGRRIENGFGKFCGVGGGGSESGRYHEQWADVFVFVA